MNDRLGLALFGLALAAFAVKVAKEIKRVNEESEDTAASIAEMILYREAVWLRREEDARKESETERMTD